MIDKYRKSLRMRMTVVGLTVKIFRLAELRFTKPILDLGFHK